MKKWIGAICSGLAGVLSLVFLAIPALTSKMSMDLGVTSISEKETYSGWELLTKKEISDMDLTAVTWYRIFAWILVVLAIAMIVVCVLQVLANLNVIKLPAIVNTVAKYALIALAVVAILTLVANFGVRSELMPSSAEKDLMELEGIKSSISVGASLWIVAIASTAAAVCNFLFAKKED